MSDMRTTRSLSSSTWRLWFGRDLATVSTRILYEVRMIVGGYPSLFLPFKRRKLRRTNRDATSIVNASTDIVIGGFPRSGNTFVNAAFRFAQKEHVLTAHHLHVPAEVIYAAKHRIPTLVIVRQPKDAVVALKLMDPKLSLKQILRAYVRYHRAILPYRDACIIATFDQVTSDLGAVIARINQRYSTRFEEFAHTDDNVASVLAILREIGYAKNPRRKFVATIPDRSSEREKERQLLKEEYDRLQGSDDFESANQLYERFASYAIP